MSLSTKIKKYKILKVVVSKNKVVKAKSFIGQYYSYSNLYRALHKINNLKYYFMKLIKFCFIGLGIVYTVTFLFWEKMINKNNYDFFAIKDTENVFYKFCIFLWSNIWKLSYYVYDNKLGNIKSFEYKKIRYEILLLLSYTIKKIMFWLPILYIGIVYLSSYMSFKQKFENNRFIKFLTVFEFIIEFLATNNLHFFIIIVTIFFQLSYRIVGLTYQPDFINSSLFNVGFFLTFSALLIPSLYITLKQRANEIVKMQFVVLNYGMGISNYKIIATDVVPYVISTSLNDIKFSIRNVFNSILAIDAYVPIVYKTSTPTQLFKKVFNQQIKYYANLHIIMFFIMLNCNILLELTYNVLFVRNNNIENNLLDE